MPHLLHNVVNSDDFAAAIRQLRRRPGWLLRRFVPGKGRRVREAWSHTRRRPTHAWDIPQVAARRVRLATGDPEVDIPEYLLTKYAPRDGLCGLSLGCGSGGKELQWASTGRFAALNCYDLSSARVEEARQKHKHQALSFETADAYQLDFAPESFDIILFEDALHHLSPVRTILERCSSWLRRDGFLFVHEYTGPRRFQHPSRHLEAADALLALLPHRLRISYEHGTLKRRVRRASKLRMRLTDPSEAVESDLIVPTVHELFTVLEERKLGGTLVYKVLDDIAHHFQHEREWLDVIFRAEDLLLAAGDIESDYTLLVARVSPHESR